MTPDDLEVLRVVERDTPCPASHVIEMCDLSPNRVRRAIQALAAARILRRGKGGWTTARAERQADPSAELLRWLDGRGWVPVEEIVPLLEGWGLTRNKGAHLLRDLVRQGRIKAQSYRTDGWTRHYEYRRAE